MVKCLNIGKDSLNDMKMKREIEDVQPFQIWQNQNCVFYMKQYWL